MANKVRNGYMLGPQARDVLQGDALAYEEITDPAGNVEQVLVRIAVTLPRPVYQDVNGAFEALGGDWQRYRKAHVFPYDVRGRLRELISTGYVPPTNHLGFFPTPYSVARRVGQIAREHGARFRLVLEPSAGDGALLLTALRSVGATPIRITAVELDMHRREHLRTIRPATVLPGGYEVMAANFLELDPGHPKLFRYDTILMNPPFSTFDDGNAAPKHLTHALRFLAPSGVLTAVIPADSLRKKMKLWATLAERAEHVEDCPADAFKAVGTNVRTQIVAFQ